MSVAFPVRFVGGIEEYTLPDRSFLKDVGFVQISEMVLKKLVSAEGIEPST
jgi:hypothetical protein